jgi:hypothetical protein
VAKVSEALNIEVDMLFHKFHSPDLQAHLNRKVWEELEFTTFFRLGRGQIMLDNEGFRMVVLSSCFQNRCFQDNWFREGCRDL